MSNIYIEVYPGKYEICALVGNGFDYRHFIKMEASCKYVYDGFAFFLNAFKTEINEDGRKSAYTITCGTTGCRVFITQNNDPMVVKQMLKKVIERVTPNRFKSTIQNFDTQRYGLSPSVLMTLG